VYEHGDKKAKQQQKIMQKDLIITAQDALIHFAAAPGGYIILEHA